MEPWNEDGDSKDWVGPIAFTPEQWAEKMAEEAMRPTYFDRFRTKPAPRPWYRRLWSKTWKLREALRGLRMGWRGELG